MNLNFEEYLGDISNSKHRQAVTKLRISSHRLSFESGRYNNTAFDKRTCKLCICNLNEVGNEQHYLMQCSNTLLKEIRYSFIQKLYTKLIAHFHYLMIKTCFYISYINERQVNNEISC